MMTTIQRRIWVALTFRGRPILEALIIALCAGDEFVLARVRVQQVVLKTEKFISELPFFFFFGFKAVLYLLEYAVPPLAWKFRRFSKMPLEKQLAYLDSWEHSPFAIKRTMFKLIKASCVCQIMGEHRVLAEMGYATEIRERIGKAAPATPASASASKSAVMHPRDASQLRTDVKETYDAIVIGSGAGGAVVAKELAEAGMRVCIVEEGGYHRTHRDLPFESVGRMYRDKGLNSTVGIPIIPVPMGRCFGGTTVINSGTCFRTPEYVLRKWRDQHGLDQLSAEDLTEAFERVEKNIHVAPAEFDVMSRSNTLMHELFQKEGLHGAPLLRNAKGCHGAGMCCYGCGTGAKQSMDRNYLPQALEAGAVAYTHARVARILTNPRTGAAEGVIAQAVDRVGRPTGTQLTLESKITVLAAGTFHTPQILRQSGIASGNPHLGRHLTLHPATKIFAEFDEEIRGWRGIPQAYYLDTFKDQGLVFEGIFTPPDLTPLTLPFVGQRLISFMKNYSRMTSFGIMISDESEGRLVWLPLFGYTYYYSLTPGDVRRFQKGIAFLSRIFLRGGAKRVFPLLPNAEFTTLEEVDAFERRKLKASDIDCMAFHPLGTCRMARSREYGVCDQNQQVFGAPGLYVSDGSIVPTSLGVNPQLTIMALATRLAGKITGRKLKPES